MHKYVSLTSEMDAIWIKFAAGASLGHTRFELHAFRSKITAVHKTLVDLYVRVVKCKTVGSCDKLQPTWQALRNLDFHLQKVLRFMAFDGIL